MSHWIPLFLFFTAIYAECPYYPKTYLKSGALADYTFFNDSKQCTDNLPQSPLPKCNQDFADVYFGTIEYLPNGTNTLPYLDLNITVVSPEFSTDVFAQLECLYAPNKENTYCHNHSGPIEKWGKNYWPCRHQRINSPEPDIQLPQIFQHICLRLHGMSQYRIIITFKPQNCQLKYIITLPVDGQVEPSIARLWDNNLKDVELYPWSPMISLDENDDDHVYIHFTPSSINPKTEVTIAVYQQLQDGKTSLIHDESVTFPSRSIKFNAPAGNYLAFAYVKQPSCRLTCDNCSNICRHTYLNFTLTDHHLSGFQSAWKLFTSFMTYLMYLILTLLVIAVITAAGIYVYYQIIRPKMIAHLPPEAVEMAAKPKVLILYSDDSPEHSTVITTFADLLHHHANAEILIDIHDLIDPSVKPSLWLIQAISDAQFVILIFSEASPRIMSGEVMISRRPFPEMFNVGVRLVIQKINDILAREHIQLQTHNQRISPALSKFIIARFDYTSSEAIPEYFSLLPCRRIVLPRDLGLLFGYLHCVEVTQRNLLEYNADLEPLNHAIASYRQFVNDNPNWLQDRFQPQHTIEVEPDPREATERLPIMPGPEEHDDETVEQLAKQYNLALPSESDNEEEGVNGKTSEKYKLIGNLDDISSASSSED